MYIYIYILCPESIERSGFCVVHISCAQMRRTRQFHYVRECFLPQRIENIITHSMCNQCASTFADIYSVYAIHSLHRRVESRMVRRGILMSKLVRGVQRVVVAVPVSEVTIMIS